MSSLGGSKKDSMIGDDTLSALSKAFPVQRGTGFQQKKPATSVIGGNKPPAQSPMKAKKVIQEDLSLSDEELSALSKQYRQYMPPQMPQGIKAQGMNDDELSALSKQYRGYLPPIKPAEKNGISDDTLSAISRQLRPYQTHGGDINDEEMSALSKQYRPYLPENQPTAEDLALMSPARRFRTIR